MSRRKLSPETRETLRKDLKERLRTGASRSAVFRELAAKYSISPETMRWYFRTVGGDGHQAVKGTGRRGRPPARARSRGPKGTKAAALQLTTVVTQLSEADLRRLVRARKLVPELNASQRRLMQLRERIENLGQEANREESRVQELERRIESLTSIKVRTGSR